MAGEQAAVDQLTLVQLRAFVVWLSRGDRWADGFWKHVTEEGLPQTVLTRLRRELRSLPYQPPVSAEGSVL